VIPDDDFKLIESGLSRFLDSWVITLASVDFADGQEGVSQIGPGVCVAGGFLDEFLLDGDGPFQEGLGLVKSSGPTMELAQAME
jgi:hypothetical protein